MMHCRGRQFTAAPIPAHSQTENSIVTPKRNKHAVSKKPFENSEIFHANSEKSERFQRKSEKSICLFYILIRLFQGRLFDCIVTEPTKKGSFENG
jgi:hypothetical protein